eukprot:COSAG02_NODE_2077_length_9916_cov_9.422489_1_plen_65_part_00
MTSVLTTIVSSMLRSDEDVAIPRQIRQAATTTPLQSKTDLRSDRANLAEPELADIARFPRKKIL